MPSTWPSKKSSRTTRPPFPLISRPATAALYFYLSPLSTKITWISPLSWSGSPREPTSGRPFFRSALRTVTAALSLGPTATGCVPISSARKAQMTMEMSENKALRFPLPALTSSAGAADHPEVPCLTPDTCSATAPEAAAERTDLREDRSLRGS